MKVHNGVTGLYYFTFGMDPHIQKDETQKALYNPIKLAAQWLQSVERFLLNNETLLVNSNGGIMPMDGTKILETVESDNIRWHDRYEDEIITLSTWAGGKHWYLSSNKNRIFTDKYDSYAEARTEALRYVPLERLNMKEGAGALPPE